MSAAASRSPVPFVERSAKSMTSSKAHARLAFLFWQVLYPERHPETKKPPLPFIGKAGVIMKDLTAQSYAHRRPGKSPVYREGRFYEGPCGAGHKHKDTQRTPPLMRATTARRRCLRFVGLLTAERSASRYVVSSNNNVPVRQTCTLLTADGTRSGNINTKYCSTAKTASRRRTTTVCGHAVSSHTCTLRTADRSKHREGYRTICSKCSKSEDLRPKNVQKRRR
jgi:hypothetical protein